jgi:photosystem II S4 domain protein
MIKTLSRFCSTMLPREELLKLAENRDTVARAIDIAEQAIKNWELTVTDFLSPPELAEITGIFNRLTEIKLLPNGGYPQAERQRIGICRTELALEATEVPLLAIEISGNFLFDSATHRDFLGAMLGAGIVREKTGDLIVLGERGAQAIIVPEMLDYLTAALTQVRSVPVKVKPIELSALQIREPKKKEMVTTEASLRLDAIASAGFGLSRSKMVDLVSGGEVRVNWKDVSQPAFQLKAGDLVAVRGKGRLEIGEVMITKKERYRINLTRYV